MAPPPSLPVAILGATSQIAGDFVLGAARLGVPFALYARRPEAVARFLADNGLPAGWNGGTLADLAAAEARFGGVVNFVGVGDPAKAREMGAAIFEATLDSDRAALALLDRAPGTPYVFLSSGAVYGTRFDAPAFEASPATFPVNQLQPQHYYSVAKLHAEAVHRSRGGDTIIDVRIFNYVSRRLDTAARFLVTDMAQAVISGQEFLTVDQPMDRDYLHPDDLRDLLLACLGAPPGTNRPVDAYSRAPISKRDLLDLMAREFGLRWRFVGQIDALNATGAKPHYRSEFRAAAELGYRPRHSSAEAIVDEVGAMLSARRVRAPGPTLP